MSEKFTNLLKTHTLRSDSMGSGKFGASRGRRKHKGVDLVVKKDDPVYAPISGKVTRVNVAYPHTDKWKGVTISTETERVKILYVSPAVVLGETVTTGELIGYAQNISLEHGGKMTDHIHVEYYINNQLQNPTNKLF
jgi:murein DD-endopeptidase MepM/ murein hydrolase activator NlpD